MTLLDYLTEAAHSGASDLFLVTGAPVSVKVEGVLRCKNPRCITSCEQELPHIFKLTDRSKKVYRCIYCETMAKNK